MSSAAPLGSHFPLPSVFRQVLKRLCHGSAGRGVRAPPWGSAHDPSLGELGSPPSAALRGSRGEGTGMELGQGWGPGARSLDQEGGTRGCQTHPPGWALTWLGTPASSCPSQQSLGVEAPPGHAELRAGSCAEGQGLWGDAGGVLREKFKSPLPLAAQHRAVRALAGLLGTLASLTTV